MPPATKRTLRHILPHLVAAAVVLLSRIPFLSRNYGFDGDAWSVARAAGVIAREGHYVRSRPPGYPLHEIACALFWRCGPLALNGITALLSAVSACLFVSVLRRAGARAADACLGGAALSLVPVVFINSTVTLDYIWALAFLLAALKAALAGRPGWAGAALGAAMGCRITSGAALIPVGILICAGAAPGARWRGLLSCAGSALSVGAMCYAPVFATYGSGFLRFVDEPMSVSLRGRLTLYGATVGVWGVAGLIGIGLACAARVARRSQPTAAAAGPGRRRRALGAACLAGVLLYLAAFLRLPLEFAYLVPLVPFGILLLFLFLPAPWLRVCLACVALSPFVGHAGLHGSCSLAGPALIDRAKKESQLRSIAQVYAHVNRLSSPSVVLVTGPDINRFRALPPGNPDFSFARHVTFEYALAPGDRDARVREGQTVYILIKEQYVYTGAFVFSRDAGGKIRMRVDRYPL